MMVPIGGITCCLSAAALYLLGRISGRDAEVLKSVTRVKQFKELAQLLDTERRVLPLVVTVSGRVGSDTPINCEYSGLQGVIVEQKAEQHFLKHNEAGSWTRDSALLLSMCKEVPWYLDDGTARVHVVGARDATGLVLIVGSEVFEESGRYLVRRSEVFEELVWYHMHGTLDHHKGLKMLGVKRIERVLPTGTPLTVVGEAVMDDFGAIQIQQPHEGPFYVSNKTIDQLIADLGKWARLCKYASMGFSVFGVCLLAKHAFPYIMERKHHYEMRKRWYKYASIGFSVAFGVYFLAKHAFPYIMERKHHCEMRKRCGHIFCCMAIMACSSHLTNCPLCRRRIDQVVRTFRHLMYEISALNGLLTNMEGS